MHSEDENKDNTRFKQQLFSLVKQHLQLNSAEQIKEFLGFAYENALFGVEQRQWLINFPTEPTYNSDLGQWQAEAEVVKQDPTTNLNSILRKILVVTPSNSSKELVQEVRTIFSRSQLGTRQFAEKYYHPSLFNNSPLTTYSRIEPNHSNQGNSALVADACRKTLGQFPPPRTTKAQTDLQEIRLLNSVDLPFYSTNTTWVRLQLGRRSQRGQSFGVINALYCPTANNPLMLLNQNGNPIHSFNHEQVINEKTSEETQNLRIESKEAATAYLTFFVECIWGDEGPFHVYVRPNIKDSKKIKQHALENEDGAINWNIKEVQSEDTINYWSFSGVPIMYDEGLFLAEMTVYPNGHVAMEDDRPVNLKVTNNYRIDSRQQVFESRTAHIAEHRPIGSFDWAAGELDGERHEQLIDVAMRQVLAQEQELRPNPYYHWPWTLELRLTHYWGDIIKRLLDRFGFNTPYPLPIIDMRGAHVQTLNDCSGNGWRDPFEKTGDIWMNFKVLLRLEGFSYDKLAYVKTHEEGRKHTRSRQEFTKAAGQKPDSMRFEKYANNLNHSPDNKWRSRLSWIYRQFPMGKPTRLTFHQQPFSELINAYRSQGDVHNLYAILSRRIAIEFGLTSERVRSSGLQTFSIFALIFGAIAGFQVSPSAWGIGLVVACFIAGLIGVKRFSSASRRFRTRQSVAEHTVFDRACVNSHVYSVSRSSLGSNTFLGNRTLGNFLSMDNLYRSIYLLGRFQIYTFARARIGDELFTRLDGLHRCLRTNGEW